MSDTNKLRMMYMTPAPEFFATELVAIEDLGQCARLVFAIPRQQGHEAFREPAVQVVVPKSMLLPMARQLAREPIEIRNGSADAALAEGDAELSFH